jgi:hypothetical protein
MNINAGVNIMKRYVRSFVSAVLAGISMVVAVPPVAAGVLYRVSSDELFFTSECTTSLVGNPINAAGIPTSAPGGLACFSKTVTVPAGVRSLYVTITTTGDTHGGAALRLACLVDGLACVTNNGTADASPTGWITLHKLPVAPGVTNCNNGGGGNGDCHDNSVAYQWCKRIALNEDLATAHPVQIRLATSIAGQSAFIEKASIYVDANVGGGGNCSGS